MACREREETESIQQVTAADWLTKACDFKYAEPSKTLPPSYEQVTSVFSFRNRFEVMYLTATKSSWTIRRAGIDFQFNQWLCGPNKDKVSALNPVRQVQSV
jgi:hypothetical protein